MLEDVLVISPFAGYANAGHAGAKTHYNYIKKLEDKYNLTILTHIRPSEEENVKKYGVKANIVRDGTPSIFEKILNRVLSKNIFSRYSFIGYAFKSLFLKEIKKLAELGYKPSYIIFDWTQCSLLIKKVKKIYPLSKCICAEQDVAFLSLYRIYKANTTFVKKLVSRIKYNTVKFFEICSLNLADEVITFNEKDKKLLESESAFSNKIRVISPYYDDYSSIERNPIGKQIIFYGAMGRYENYASAIWFIKNVLPKLSDDVHFIVIGSNPDKSLMQYEGKKVKITGFIPDVKPYFESAICLVAPLVLGAGIKVKILEAFSAGIPVLTNEIGIEGIPAENKKDYLHCTTPDEYVECINKIICDSEYAKKLGESGRDFVLQNFNYNQDTYLRF